MPPNKQKPLTPRQKANLGASRHEFYWEIRGHMHRAGYTTVPQFAQSIEVSDTAVNRTLQGTLHSKSVLEALHTQCNVPKEMLFSPHAWAAE